MKKYENIINNYSNKCKLSKLILLFYTMLLDLCFFNKKNRKKLLVKDN